MFGTTGQQGLMLCYPRLIFAASKREKYENQDLKAR